MVKRMLIDTTHAEETRVVVLDGNRLEEFDYETSTKKQIKGNIYLAKVTRVEPSLQAAFVEYGGNRHGFLAFSEIHPDYYRIPVADREALLAMGGTRNDDGEFSDDDDQSSEEAEELAARRQKLLRHYKIQDVIARRQIMLVQVVKEERGTKGAALTTYLSLAGRYCVLMPNTPRGGGVSRKIVNTSDRKRLKGMLDEFEIPQGMAVIVRTAGMERAKTEIRRDYEYLLRLWDEIRETTLNSTAPALIYEEGNLIKRSIRDLYTRDIDEVLVEGDEGYKTAKAFMKMLMPSHAKRVQPYKDDVVPLLHRFQVENQLDLIHNPTVTLRSGGYIVINPTEALVSIDVNSGRATKERHIEETALKTNLEAADEIARQLRLRDLAGLIVIDFIDMEDSRNNAAVERRLKEAMKSDRARIQIGKISSFGLLELSRQRLRPSLLEASTEKCPHCGGTGLIRSVESTALHVLRAVEEEAIRGRAAEIIVYVPTNVALYLLNQKRATLQSIETRLGMMVQVGRDDTLIPPAHRIEKLRARSPDQAPVQIKPLPAPPPREDDEPVEEFEAETQDEGQSDGRREEGRGEEGRGEEGRGEESRGRRDRGRGRGRDRNRGRDQGRDQGRDWEEAGAAPAVAHEAEGEDGSAVEGQPLATGADDGEGEAGRRRRRRRRRRRGGREAGEGMGAEAIQAEGGQAFGEDDADLDEDGAEDQGAEGQGTEGRGTEGRGIEGGGEEPEFDENGQPRKRRRRGKRGGRRRNRREDGMREDGMMAEAGAAGDAAPAVTQAVAVETGTELAPEADVPEAAEPETAEPDASKPRGRNRRRRAEPTEAETGVADAAAPEAPAEAEAPKPRKRTGRAASAAEDVAEPPAAKGRGRRKAAPESEPAEAPAEAPAAAPVAEPAITPAMVEAAPAAEPVAEPNPAITVVSVDALPKQERKGWWRRG